jgi:crotonobetainyl-CoA:carnitine CoA-transferase CaiB-like acyl-CoA transferase
MSYEQPYAGLKVIDLSQGVAGPYCAMLLAQYGANVIKVEPPEGGDWSRGLGVKYGDQTAYSIPVNLGKRSIALDLKTDDGRAVLWRLLAQADVFLQGFRPGVIERLGFGYASVAEREPRLIYVSISGFGPTGPLAERPAMDPVLQAFTGLIAENVGEDGVPHRIPIIAIDMTTALYAFSAVAAALFARRDAAEGRLIDASLMQAAAGLQVVRMLQQYLEAGTLRPPAGPNGVYQAADGWISVTVPRQHEWLAFCDAMGLAELADDARFAVQERRVENADAMRALLRPVFAMASVAHWSKRLAARKVMHERLNTYAEFLAHPHTMSSGAIAWVDHPAVPQKMPLPNLIGVLPFGTDEARTVAPRLGEHSAEILREHSYTESEISDLGARKVIGLQEKVAE